MVLTPVMGKKEVKVVRAGATSDWSEALRSPGEGGGKAKGKDCQSNPELSSNSPVLVLSVHHACSLGKAQSQFSILTVVVNIACVCFSRLLALKDSLSLYM